MSLKSCAVLLSLCFSTCQGQCKIDGFTVDALGVLWAAKGGHYAGVYGETIVKKKTALPTTMVNEGFATVDGFTIGGTTSYFMKGTDFIGVGAGDAIVMKKKGFKEFSAELEKNFPSGADGMGADDSGNLYFAKGGEYMGFSSSGAVLKQKTKFPAVLTTNGFDTVDSFDIGGSSTYFTKGPYIIGIGAGDTITLPKQCLPGEITSQGFYAVDGMSFDALGTAWLVKGGHYMGVRGGKVVKAKAAMPASMASEGFATIDSMALAPDGTLYVTNGDSYMGIKNDVVTTKKTKFSKATLDAGFTAVKGLAFWADGTACFLGTGATDGHYMCEKSGVVVTAKKELPKVVKDAGFGTGVDGFHMGLDGTYALSKDGYYIIGKGEALTTLKTPLPSSLSDELCGKDSCLGPVVNGVQQTLSASTLAGKKGTTSKSSYTFLAMPVLLLLGVASLL